MRLIDADYVLAHLKPYEPSDEGWGVTGGTALRLIHTAINNAPTIDVAPVVHGRWIMHNDELGLTCECSVCHIETMGDGNYCPSCGAKMDGGKNHAID